MSAGLGHNLFQAPPLDHVSDAAVAIIVDEHGRYLMQLRDDKAGIFYPDHWGLFGGAIDSGEDAETALRRELREELGYDLHAATTFTTMDYGFEALGGGRALRTYFELAIFSHEQKELKLGEGRAMESFGAADLLLKRRVVPYDSFAIWLHYVRATQKEQRNT